MENFEDQCGLSWQQVIFSAISFDKFQLPIDFTMYFIFVLGLGLGAGIIYLDYIETKKGRSAEKVPEPKLPQIPTPPIVSKTSTEDTKKKED